MKERYHCLGPLKPHPLHTAKLKVNDNKCLFLVQINIWSYLGFQMSFGETVTSDSSAFSLFQ